MACPICRAEKLYGEKRQLHKQTCFLNPRARHYQKLEAEGISIILGYKKDPDGSRLPKIAMLLTEHGE